MPSRYEYTVPAINGKLAHPINRGEDVVGWNIRSRDVVITTTKDHPELEGKEGVSVTIVEVPAEPGPEPKPEPVPEPEPKPEPEEEVEEEEDEEEEEEEEEEEYLDDWTVAELRKEARVLKIKGCSRMSKAELVDAVFEAEAQE